MNAPVHCHEAAKADLPEILRLHAQPDMDDGQISSLAEAEQVFDRMARYPDYRLYVAIRDGGIVGTFARLITDKLGHQGAPSGMIEDVAIDPQCQGQGIGKTICSMRFECAARRDATRRPFFQPGAGAGACVLRIPRF